VLAIVVLPDQWVDMLDGSQSPAVIMLRGFRCLLRVKQLDPVAAFYHCSEDSSLAATILLDLALPRLQATTGEGTAARSFAVSQLAEGLESYQAGAEDFANVVGTTGRSPRHAGERLARLTRQQLIAEYSPVLFDMIIERLRNDGGFSDGPVLDVASYVQGFAASMGTQLGRMYQGRFLHDYHHPGVGRYRAGWPYTLLENNVTLAAEFADLETGIFVDALEDAVDSLQITEAEVRILQENFDACHQRDVGLARRISMSLAAAASLAGYLENSVQELVQEIFDDFYSQGRRN
jgi:hypothetical protein